MQSVWTWTLVLAAGAVCGAALAAEPASPRSIEQALEQLDTRLAKASTVNPEDLLRDRASARFRVAHAAIRQKQCLAASANPLMTVPAPARATLRARVADGRVRVDGDSIEIELPLAALADLPSEYLRTRGGATDARAYDLLSARVVELIATYDPSACAFAWAASTRRPMVVVPPTF